MSELSHSEPSANLPERVGSEVDQYSISGTVDNEHGLVWVDDIELPREGEDGVVDPILILQDFASRSSSVGATELRFVCPELKDLQLLAHAFASDKLKFYETIMQNGEQKQIERSGMSLDEALSSLQEIESFQTDELFPTNWFDVGVDIRS